VTPLLVYANSVAVIDGAFGSFGVTFFVSSAAPCFVKQKKRGGISQQGFAQAAADVYQFLRESPGGAVPT